MIEFIKQIWNEIIKTLLYLYDKLTYPIGVEPISEIDSKTYFRPEGIFFQNYIFKAASVYPSGLVSYTNIQEILPAAFPPEIRTKQGEILFIPAELKRELERVAQINQIPLVSRVDVWSYILDPFLDTEFSPEDQENTLRLLEENNISRLECQTIRDSISEAMYAYNFTSGLWEWVHLGLYDVLAANSGILSGHRHTLPEEKFKDFYYRAMEIANRAKLITTN
ncbi:MAG: hypothetical protein HY819_03570 [Acidobacteria bacterium]|nr:hypothetical protein [Acidobacteriota bacterium]